MSVLSFDAWWSDFYWLVYANISIPLTDFQKPTYQKHYDKGLSPEETFEVCFLR